MISICVPVFFALWICILRLEYVWKLQLRSDSLQFIQGLLQVSPSPAASGVRLVGTSGISVGVWSAQSFPRFISPFKTFIVLLLSIFSQGEWLHLGSCITLPQWWSQSPQQWAKYIICLYSQQGAHRCINRLSAHWHPSKQPLSYWNCYSGNHSHRCFLVLSIWPFFRGEQSSVIKILPKLAYNCFLALKILY